MKEEPDVLLLTDDDEDIPVTPAPTRTRRGRAANVKQEVIDPDETESDEDRPLANATRNKGKGKGKAKAASISSEDDDSGSDFVLSEEDVKPARSAVNRAAILRATERRMNSSSSTDLPTPLASGSATPLADKVWASESEAEESEYLSDLSDAPPLKKKGKGKAKPKGQRLDGGEGEDLPEEWKKKRKTRRNKEEESEEKKQIKKMERELAKDLGRKLTQGERNQIRLQMVSCAAVRNN